MVKNPALSFELVSLESQGWDNPACDRTPLLDDGKELLKQVRTTWPLSAAVARLFWGVKWVWVSAVLQGTFTRVGGLAFALSGYAVPLCVCSLEPTCARLSPSVLLTCAQLHSIAPCLARLSPPLLA